MEQPLLEVKGLCQTFGKHRAVENVSFTIEKGEILGLVGEIGRASCRERVSPRV